MQTLYLSGRYTRPQHQKSKIQVASFSVFDFLAKPGRESPQRQAPKNVLLAKKCGDFVFLGGLVGAETCCQTVQKVGEVKLGAPFLIPVKSSAKYSVHCKCIDSGKNTIFRVFALIVSAQTATKSLIY